MAEDHLEQSAADGEEPVSAEIIPLPTKPEGSKGRDQDATVEKLYELRDLMTEVLLSQLRRPGVKASMVSAGRAFLADHKHLLKEPIHREALASMAAALVSLKESGLEFPFPVTAKEQTIEASEPEAAVASEPEPTPEPTGDTTEEDPFASVRGTNFPFPVKAAQEAPAAAAEPTPRLSAPAAVTFNPPEDDGEDF